MSPDFVEHRVEPIPVGFDFEDCSELLEIVNSLYTNLQKEHAEMHNDLMILFDIYERHYTRHCVYPKYCKCDTCLVFRELREKWTKI